MAFIPTPNKALKSVTLNAGESFVLPTGAQIISLICDGATADSQCELPECEQYVCSYFKITLDSSDTDGRPLDEPTTLIQELKVGTTVFDFEGFRIIDNGGVNSIPPTPAQLNAFISDPGLFTFTHVGYNQLQQRQLVWLYFRVPQTYLELCEIQITDAGNPAYYKRGTSNIACNSYTNP